MNPGPADKLTGIPTSDRPYLDWPPCRRGNSPNLTVADVLDMDPTTTVLICDAKHGGWLVAILTITGLRRMIAQSTANPANVKLKHWTPVSWATALRRMDSDIKYARQDGHLDPYTGIEVHTQKETDHAHHEA